MTTADLTSPVSLLFSIKSCPQTAIFQVFASVQHTEPPKDYILNWMVTWQQDMPLKCKYALFYVLHLVKHFTLVMLMPETCTRMG